MIGFGGPGQRGIEKGGRDQDLHTPLYQTLALMACGAWVLMWSVFIALVVGSWLAFAISGIVFYIRWRRYERSLRWDVGNAVLHVLVVVLLDGIWTTYIMTWTPWQKLIFTLLCLLMASPGIWFYYTITIRVADPHYPSPRKASDQRQPQMPWDRDDNGGIPITDTNIPAREELNVRIEDLTDDPEQPDIAMCLLFSPAGHPGMLARYAAALVRTDGSRAAFSHAGGKHVNGATFYKYTPDEFEELEIEAKRAGLVERERDNQPYKLTLRGKFTFNRVAKHNLTSVSLSPTPEPWG